MKNRLKDIIDKAKVLALHDETPAPSTLEKLLTRDLDAWRETKAAIEKAKRGE